MIFVNTMSLRIFILNIILKLILDGKSNKGIAYMLQRSERTIEVHRSHIMRKFNVDNVVDLVKRASSLSGFEKSE